MRTALCDLMYDRGSDKAQPRDRIIKQHHTYTEYYSSLFSALRHTATFVFELGIGSLNPDIPSNMIVAGGTPGGSLRAWREWFAKADIYAADIDYALVKSINEPRIHPHWVDQTKPDTISKMWKDVGNIVFDIIIDDGLHNFEGNKIFLEKSIHKVAPGGYYVVEDVKPDNAIKLKAMFSEWRSRFPIDTIELVTLPGTPKLDNTLLVIKTLA